LNTVLSSKFFSILIKEKDVLKQNLILHISEEEKDDEKL